MRTLKLTLTYVGTEFAGWQSQPNQPTIQDALEAALTKITGEEIRTVASGRTDAGVHALGQVVSFRSTTYLEPSVLARALNANLPPQIRVRELAEAAADFHAIRDATRKCYRYIIEDGPLPNVFQLNMAWQFPTKLDDAAMRRATTVLVGRHDFASFQSSGSERESTVREVYSLSIDRHYSLPPQPSSNCDAIWIEIEADGFLYNMVRNIVGTLVEVGRGAQPESWVAEVLAARDRRRAGPTAPPHGLFLVRVDY